MSNLDFESENDPIFWVGGHPVRGAILLVIIHSACLLACLVVLAVLRKPLWLEYLSFSTDRFIDGHIFTPLTYGFVHEPEGALFFAFGMYMLWVFGGEVERFFGRRIFFQLYALLWFLTPLVLLAFHGLGEQHARGASAVNFGIFVAFAALYPSVRLMFGIPAMWAAVILIAISAIVDIARGDLVQLVSMLVTAGSAWTFVAWQKGQITWQLPAFLRPKPKFRVLPKASAPPRAVAPKPVRDASMDDVDRLLDKIAHAGSEPHARRARPTGARVGGLEKEPLVHERSHPFRSARPFYSRTMSQAPALAVPQELHGTFGGFVRTLLGKRRLLLHCGEEELLLKVPKELRHLLEDRLEKNQEITVHGAEEVEHRSGDRVFLVASVQMDGAHFRGVSQDESCIVCPIQVCAKKNCWKSGGKEVFAALESALVRRGLAHAVEVQTVGCMDHCKKAPNVAWNGQEYHRCTLRDTEWIAEHVAAAVR
jgi:membrane associated rhomboid family serine protease